ncbi:hypothetical protein [Nocardia salmonicida]|uniref:hypothetical protein n=1 Tax=Nocardia salmonicida TaxID=53431 RepID=UPI002E2BE431|nr:hypothetical protein [Nocardia salmonicida]
MLSTRLFQETTLLINLRQFALIPVKTVEFLWGASKLTQLSAARRGLVRPQGWGDVVTCAACNASQIGEASVIRVEDIDTEQRVWNLRRQTSPGPGSMLDMTKGERARRVPFIEEIRPMLLDRIRARQDKPYARLFTAKRRQRSKPAYCTKRLTGTP